MKQVLTKQALTCIDCAHWERSANSRSFGHCPIFDKETSSFHGTECTAITRKIGTADGTTSVQRELVIYSRQTKDAIAVFTSVESLRQFVDVCDPQIRIIERTTMTTVMEREVTL